MTLGTSLCFNLLNCKMGYFFVLLWSNNIWVSCNMEKWITGFSSPFWASHFLRRWAPVFSILKPSWWTMRAPCSIAENDTFRGCAYTFPRLFCILTRPLWIICLSLCQLLFTWIQTQKQKFKGPSNCPKVTQLSQIGMVLKAPDFHPVLIQHTLLYLRLAIKIEQMWLTVEANELGIWIILGVSPSVTGDGTAKPRTDSN